MIVVKNTVTNQSRGYGFIEFDHKSDFLSAYKYGDGKRIDGKRVIVDFERGRTMLKWRPRRLGVLNLIRLKYIYLYILNIKKIRVDWVILDDPNQRN
mgnify:CR=1 FL=1